MRIGVCLHWREVSFAVASQAESCGPWFSLGAASGKLDYARLDARLHLWLTVGPWHWSKMWEREGASYPEGGVPIALSGALARATLDELARPSLFTRFLPRYTSSYVVVHGEVIHLVERIEPDSTGGDEIRIDRIQFLPHLAGNLDEWSQAREEFQAAFYEHTARAQAAVEPPTSACSRCGRSIPVADLYTGQRTGRQVCERCLDAMVALGVATRPAGF